MLFQKLTDGEISRLEAELYRMARLVYFEHDDAHSFEVQEKARADILSISLILLVACREKGI